VNVSAQGRIERGGDVLDFTLGTHALQRGGPAELGAERSDEATLTFSSAHRFFSPDLILAEFFSIGFVSFQRDSLRRVDQLVHYGFIDGLQTI
jgi:hypothetical protein